MTLLAPPASRVARPDPPTGSPAGARPAAALRPASRRRRLHLGSWAVAAATVVLAGLGWQALHTTSGGPGRAITTQGLVLVGPVVLVLVAVALVAERRWPAVPRPLTARGHRQDLAYLALYVVVAVPVVTLVGTGFAVTVLRLAPWLAVHPFSGVPHWALVVLALVLADACNWAAHLLNHRVATLWRYHALHHSQEEMSILTSFRAHPLIHASFEVVALPILLLGLAGTIPVSVLVGYVLLSTLPHANVPWDFGPLRYVMVTPAYHRVHHDRENVRGANLATVLVVWDVLAGLAVFPSPGSDPAATGLAGRPLPVEQSPDAGGWLSVLIRQLAEPLWNSPAVPALVPSGDQHE